ncbi:hypothetical protein HDR59_00585 [bacterium]|nr:hypothetical protein [bacterium]
MNKKYLIGIFTGFALAGCAKYSQKELVQIDSNVRRLNKEFVGKKVYMCNENKGYPVKEIIYEQINKQIDKNGKIYYSVSYNVNNKKTSVISVDEEFDFYAIKEDILSQSGIDVYAQCSKEQIRYHRKFWDEIRKHFIGKKVYFGDCKHNIVIDNIYHDRKTSYNYYNDEYIYGLWLSGYSDDNPNEQYKFLFMEIGTDIPSDLINNLDYNSVIQIIEKRLSGGGDIASPYKESYYYKTCSNTEKQMMENPQQFLGQSNDIKEKLTVYLKVVEPRISELLNDNYDINNIKDISDELESIRPFVKSNKKIECFVKKAGDDYNIRYVDTSDKCILARRNNNDEMFFDYKKYFHNINNEGLFHELVSNFKYYFSYDDIENIYNDYCNNLKETTTTEKKQCEKNVESFFNNPVYCHDKKKKEWEKLLENSEDLKQTLNEIVSEGLNISNANILVKGIYGSFPSNILSSLAFQKIKSFGRDNFCIINGWENDLKELLKKNTNNKKTFTINLN